MTAFPLPRQHFNGIQNPAWQGVHAGTEGCHVVQNTAYPTPTRPYPHPQAHGTPSEQSTPAQEHLRRRRAGESPTNSNPTVLRLDHLIHPDHSDALPNDFTTSTWVASLRNIAVNTAYNHPRKRLRVINRRLPNADSDSHLRRCDLPPARMQYTGDYRGGTWNSQALFASLPSKQAAKTNHTWKLFEQHDFMGIQETHGTK